jgi:hypothetical protein
MFHVFPVFVMVSRVNGPSAEVVVDEEGDLPHPKREKIK